MGPLFQGSFHLRTATQGVALGWHVAAPLVRAEFLTALVAALNDRTKLPALESFPAWRGQTPLPIETLWPD